MELQQTVAASFAECPHILQRKVPREVCPFFFGASLLTLEKDGGVRPIAVGCTLRRLVAIVAENHIMDAMGPLLAQMRLSSNWTSRMPLTPSSMMK